MPLTADAGTLTRPQPISPRTISGFGPLVYAIGVSNVGSQVTAIALPTLAILVLGFSDGEVAQLRVLETIAFPVLGLLIGTLSDHRDARTFLVWADAIRLLAILSVPIAATAFTLSGLHVMVVAVLLGIGNTMFNVPFMAIVPRMIPPELRPEANAEVSLAASVSKILGPSLAGLLVRFVGAASALILDAATFAVSLALLRRVPKMPPATVPSAHLQTNIGAHALGGLKTVVRSEVLRNVALSASTINLAFGAVPTILILFAYRDLGLSPGEYGVALTIGSLGFIVGARTAARARRVLGYARLLALSAIMLAAAFASLAAAGLTDDPIWVVSVGWGAVALATPLFDVAQVTVRQTASPPDMVGTVNAVIRTATWGALPLGAAAAGVAVTKATYEAVLIGFGAITLLAAAPALLTGLARMHTDDDLIAHRKAQAVATQPSSPSPPSKEPT